MISSRRNRHAIDSTDTQSNLVDLPFNDGDLFPFTFLPLSGLLGFFLNAISIVSFLTVKEMRNPSNFFVFNLAVADLSLNINGLTAAYASYVRYQTQKTR